MAESHMCDAICRLANRTDFLDERGVEITNAIRWRRVEAAFEALVILIAQALSKVVEILGVLQRWSIRNLGFFENFQDGFGVESHDIDSGVMADKSTGVARPMPV